MPTRAEELRLYEDGIIKNNSKISDVEKKHASSILNALTGTDNFTDLEKSHPEQTAIIKELIYETYTKGVHTSVDIAALQRAYNNPKAKSTEDRLKKLQMNLMNQLKKLGGNDAEYNKILAKATQKKDPNKYIAFLEKENEAVVNVAAEMTKTVPHFITSKWTQILVASDKMFKAEEGKPEDAVRYLNYMTSLTRRRFGGFFTRKIRQTLKNKPYVPRTGVLTKDKQVRSSMVSDVQDAIDFIDLKEDSTDVTFIRVQKKALLMKIRQAYQMVKEHYSNSGGPDFSAMSEVSLKAGQ